MLIPKRVSPVSFSFLYVCAVMFRLAAYSFGTGYGDDLQTGKFPRPLASKHIHTERVCAHVVVVSELCPTDTSQNGEGVSNVVKINRYQLRLLPNLISIQSGGTFQIFGPSPKK